jgi:hypothetical protein
MLPLTIFGDNKGSIDLANNLIVGKGTKHIDIKYHYIRQSIEKGLILLQWLPSAKIVTDLLTKLLPHVTFDTHHASLRLVTLDTVRTCFSLVSF